MNDQAVALKKMLADAVLLGTTLAEFNYARPIRRAEAIGVWKCIEGLRASTRRFLDSAALEALSDQDVFPLYGEILSNLSPRSDTCTQEKK